MRRATFWWATAERVVKTFAQTLAAALSAGGLDLLSVPWQTAVATAGLAAVLSLLTSIVSAPIGPAGSPSIVPGDPGPEPGGYGVFLGPSPD